MRVDAISVASLIISQTLTPRRLLLFLRSRLKKEGALPVAPIFIFDSGRPPENLLPLASPGAPEFPEDMDPSGIQIDLTAFTLAP